MNARLILLIVAAALLSSCARYGYSPRYPDEHAGGPASDVVPPGYNFAKD